MGFSGWFHVIFAFLGSFAEAAPYPFAPCTSSNNYLENKLKEPPASECIQNSRITDPLPILDPLSRNLTEISCMAHAMARFSEKGVGYTYKKCSSPSSVPLRMKHRPCISPNYVRYIYNRYQNVSRCVMKGSSITPRETFPLFALESGFHVNVVSGSGCRGVGQLSRIAAREMDLLDEADSEKFQKPYTRGSLMSHSECAEFESNLTGAVTDHSKQLGECEVIAIPENPDVNLLYSLRLYRMLKDEKAFSTVQKNSTQLKNLGLSQEEVDTLQVRLARIMYNGGYPAIQGTFNAFMKTLGQKSLQGASKGEAIWKLYTDYVYLHYPATGAARRTEVRDYVSKIEKARTQIEEKAEGPCF